MNSVEFMYNLAIKIKATRNKTAIDKLLQC